MAETKIIQPQKGGQDYFVRTNVDVAIYGGVLAAGKEQPLDCKILTPQGWVRNGDLKVGDMICTPFSEPQPIKQLFPHKNKKIFRFSTTDGRSTECGLEHLWMVRTKKQIFKYRNHLDMSRNYMLLTTEEIISRLNHGETLFIPVPNAQEFEEKEYIISPYALGVLLGDGCLTDSVLKEGKNSIVISNQEQDVIDKFSKEIGGYRIYVQPNCYSKSVFTDRAREIRDYLVEKNLNTHSYNKYIPEEYFWGSIEQRRQLLYGLFDTDGCVQKKNRYQYVTTSRRLKDDFVRLCRSLGYVATVKKDKRDYKYTSGECFCVNIKTDDVIFSSAKHYARYDRTYCDERKYGRTNNHIRIESVEYLRNDDAQCLYLDDDFHLYITDDFIVTHNTFASILAVAEPAKDPKFRATFFRRTFGQLKQAGGIVDDFKNAYGKEISMTISEAPRATFSSGAYAEMQQVQDENPKKVIEKFKGLQSDAIFFDELTGFEWFTFTYLMSRCRGKGKWTGKVRATTNPSKRHWLRTFLDWYIRPDGLIDPAKSGWVRYFYIYGDKVSEVAWGDTKEEVYEKCKITIDRKLASFKGKFTYKDLIKSFTFILGNLAENLALTDGNAGYAGNVAATGGKMSDALLSGNWNVDVDLDEGAPISSEAANSVFTADPQMNNDRWITSDLADTGTDNFLAIAWNGFHIMDILILTRTTPRQNAEHLKIFAQKHDVADDHIIYDAIRGTYINDYIEDAVPFVSYRAPMGMYARLAYNLKAECYLRLVKMINDGRLSMDEVVASSRYIHAKLNQNVMIATEFVEECSVVRFKDMPSGKKQLLSKKEMNAMLGKGRSMDLLDPIAMRMLPVLDLPYGDELTGSMPEEVETEEEDENIYEDNFWA